jgi:hypothetical protein
VLQTLLPWARTLADTPLSTAIQNALWIVPAVQCVHILAVAGIVGAVLMLDLRILGLAGASQSLDSAARRFTPWIWGCGAMALTTGLVMVIAEPVRDLINLAFWAKMSALLVGLAATAGFQRALNSNGGAWEASPGGRTILRAGAIATLLIWSAVVVLGRLIAYAQIKLG